jgi:hypothetical protein
MVLKVGEPDPPVNRTPLLYKPPVKLRLVAAILEKTDRDP